MSTLVMPILHAHAQMLQSSPIVCDPMVCSPSGSSVCGISQARILEWVAISFSRGIFLTQGFEPSSLALQADSLLLNNLGSPTLNLY